MPALKPNKSIYLDYAAATPLNSKVRAFMLPFLNGDFGNPSSLHLKGLNARRAVETSRKEIAQLIGVKPEEIFFTSGGTESCNLAIFGVVNKLLLSKSKITKFHFIATAIEHHAVLEPLKNLKALGHKITLVKPDRQGIVSAKKIIQAITNDTVLISVMLANNEIGSVQPVAKIAKALLQINRYRAEKKLRPIWLHTDASQALGFLDVNPNRLGVDILSATASKIYGPKGSGFLFVKKPLSLAPIIYGGGQERGLRSGTENVAAIVGLAKAIKIITEKKLKETGRLRDLQKYFLSRQKKLLPKVILNGPPVGEFRLPNNINLEMPNTEGEAVMLYLDAQGIYVSTGSACSTGSAKSSHVLSAIGKNSTQAKSSIRISFGDQTSKNDVRTLLKVLVKVLPLIRK